MTWANASNTPFRKYKSWIHEGGISTPFIVHWPEGIGDKGALRRQPAQLPDVMATVLEVTGSAYPERIGQRSILPHEGFSLCDAFADKAHGREILTWEHEGNCGIRKGRWKLVREFNKWGEENHRGYRSWELYDMETDRSELNDLAERVKHGVYEAGGFPVIVPVRGRRMLFEPTIDQLLCDRGGRGGTAAAVFHH